MAARAELVDAVLGQGRDQPREVAAVLRDRVALPEVADGVVFLGVEVTAEQLDHRVVLDVLDLGHSSLAFR
jgi:hypothetical protein